MDQTTTVADAYERKLWETHRLIWMHPLSVYMPKEIVSIEIDRFTGQDLLRYQLNTSPSSCFGGITATTRLRVEERGSLDVDRTVGVFELEEDNENSLEIDIVEPGLQIHIFNNYEANASFHITDSEALDLYLWLQSYLRLEEHFDGN